MHIAYFLTFCLICFTVSISSPSFRSCSYSFYNLIVIRHSAHTSATWIEMLAYTFQIFAHTAYLWFWARFLSAPHFTQGAGKARKHTVRVSLTPDWGKSTHNLLLVWFRESSHHDRKSTLFWSKQCGRPLCTFKVLFFFEKTKQKQNNPPLFQTKSGSLLLAPERQYTFSAIW